MAHNILRLMFTQASLNLSKSIISMLRPSDYVSTRVLRRYSRFSPFVISFIKSKYRTITQNAYENQIPPISCSCRRYSLDSSPYGRIFIPPIGESDQPFIAEFSASAELTAFVAALLATPGSTPIHGIYAPTVVFKYVFQ